MLRFPQLHRFSKEISVIELEFKSQLIEYLPLIDIKLGYNDIFLKFLLYGRSLATDWKKCSPKCQFLMLIIVLVSSTLLLTNND